MPPSGRRNNPLVSKYWTEAEGLIDPMVGRTVTIDEILDVLPNHRDGRRPRGKTAVRKLRHRLRVVARGPNGRLGSGSSFEVLARTAPPSSSTASSLEEEFLKMLMESDAQKRRKRPRVGNRRRSPRDPSR